MSVVDLLKLMNCCQNTFTNAYDLPDPYTGRTRDYSSHRRSASSLSRSNLTERRSTYTVGFLKTGDTKEKVGPTGRAETPELAQY